MAANSNLYRIQEGTIREAQEKSARELAAVLAPSMVRAFLEDQIRPAKTKATYKTDLQAFSNYLKFAGTATPTRSTVLDFYKWATSEHPQIKADPDHDKGWTQCIKDGRPIFTTCRATTAAQYIRTLKAYYKWTEEQGLFENIARTIHLPSQRGQVTRRRAALTPEEFQKVEEVAGTMAKSRQLYGDIHRIMEGKQVRHYIKPRTAEEQDARLLAMFLLAGISGLRTIELSRAKVKDFVKEGGQHWLFVWGKGHQETDTRKALPPETVKALTYYLALRGNPPKEAPLFVATGNRSGGQALEARTISAMLKKAMQAAGYDSERYTAHSLRHTAGHTALEVTGKNIYKTQQYMRHSNPKTTEIYLHDSAEEQEPALAVSISDYLHRKA